MVTKSLLLSQTYLEEIQFLLSNDQTAEFLEKSGFAGKITRHIPSIFDVTFENVNPNSRLDAGFVFIENQSKKEVCVDIVTFFTLPNEGEYELRVYQLGRKRELHEDSPYRLDLDTFKKETIAATGNSSMKKGKELLQSCCEFVSQAKKDVIIFCNPINMDLFLKLLEITASTKEAAFDFISIWPEKVISALDKINTRENVWLMELERPIAKGLIIMRDSNDFYWASNTDTSDRIQGAQIINKETIRKLKIILESVKGYSCYYQK